MSEFHGGFFVERVDGALLQPIRRAMRAYLLRATAHGDAYEIAFAARRGAPVMHVAVRNEDADGKGYAFFHEEHQVLGADIARAAGAAVHAYHYENQTGSEGVTSFDATGAQVASDHESWDDFAEREGIDELGDLLPVLPLGALAEKLGVERSFLDQLLPYDTPTLRVALDGDVPDDALSRYLASAPSAPRRPPPGWREQTLYFPESWLPEIDALASRLGEPAGTILHEAFEIAKPDLYALPAPENDEGNVPAPLPIPAREIASTLEVPERGAPLAELASDDKAGMKVALPPEVLQQVKELAAHLDRSLSWVVQRAWRVSRERLHGAKAR